VDNRCRWNNNTNIYNITMIIDVILSVFATLLSAFAIIAPSWQIWPDEVLNGIYYISAKMTFLDIIFPIDTVINIIIFIINFEIAFFSYKLASKLIGLFRGSGRGLEPK